MGNDQTKPAENNNSASQQTQTKSQNEASNSSQYDDDQQYFIVQEINKIKLKAGLDENIYFWIDPRIYNQQNGKNLKSFKQNLTIEQFSSIGSLQNQLANLDSVNYVRVISAASLPDENYKYMNQQKKIAQIILFCQNQQRAKLLMKNFSKITAVGYSSIEVLQIINKIPIKQVKNNVLFMVEEDMNLMNKYRLNYYCLTNQKNKKKAKNQFANLAKKLYPDQKTIIQDFVKNYSLQLKGQQKRKQTLDWVFKDSFYWDLVQNLPKITTDPRRLAYLRTPVKDIYQSIQEGYKEMKKKPTELFIVVEFSEQQKQKIAQSHDSYLIFTTFIKGFTNEVEANNEFKSRGSNAFLFQIMQAKKLHEPLDFGYLQRIEKKSPDVIFNIYNFFKVCQISINTRRGALEYGSLAQIFKMRLDPNARGKITASQKSLLRNYDYFEDLMKKIKNQGNILQLSGYYKQSIKVYDKKLQQINRTNKDVVALDEIKMSKGDAYKMDEQYNLAQKVYLEVQSQKLKLVAKVKLIELYFARQNLKKVDELIDEIEPEIQRLRDWGFMEDYFRAKNYLGLNLMKKQKYKEANKHYKNLKLQISDFYNYRTEGIPLVHEIYQNMAISQTKNNNHDEALNLLNSTKSWQQLSCGRGPTLLATQKMIQGVYTSKGDKEGIELSKQQVQKMQINQSSVSIFIDASGGAAKIQNSIQQSFINIDLDSSAPKVPSNKNVNIEQSAINIDL